MTAGVTLSDPDVASAPDQPPLRVQAVAFFEDQFSVEAEPGGILLADAVSVTLGIGATTGVTVTVTAVW